jgi:inner membrane protein
MDDLTHALAGSLLGRANPSKKKGLVLACVLGALVPDFDAVLTLFNHHLYMTEHRGFTHSLLGFLPMALLASGLAWLFTRKKPDHAVFAALFIMSSVGLFSHLLLDWCTSFGTMLLWPDRSRFALDHLFIIDFWYMAVLGLPLFLSFHIKRFRAPIALAGITLALSYHAFVAYEHHRALLIATQDRPTAEAQALPEALSPLRWSLFDRQDGVLRYTHLDFMRPHAPLIWTEWKEPPMTPSLHAAFNDPEVRSFLWFARVPMWEETKRPDGTTLVTFWEQRYRSAFGKLGPSNARRFGASVVVRDGQVVPDPKS